MRLIDTSAWIEFLRDTSIGQKVKQLLPAESEWLVPSIVQLELAKWAMREGDEERVDGVIAKTTMCVVVALDTDLAIAAAEVWRKHKLPTADAVVYATARSHNADLVTCDSHFDGLDSVIYVPKGKQT